MTLEDCINAQIELGGEVSVRLGRSQDRASASLMTWSDKADGTHFWDVAGNTVTHLGFVAGGARNVFAIAR